MVSQIDPTAVGQNQLTGPKEALFLKMYSGRVLDTFQTKNVMEGMVDVQTISSGKSFTFPVVGRAEAKYHLRGENMLDPANGYLNQIQMAEREIFIDRPLVSARTTDDWDDMINHWEAASRLAEEQGNALARKRDKQLLQLIHIASQTDPALDTTLEPLGSGSVEKGGTISATTAGGAAWGFTNKAAAESVIKTIGAAAARMAERNVPMEEIYVAMTPQDYFAALTVEDSPFIKYETNKNGPNGDVSDKTAINRIAGFKIFYTNHLPQAAVGSEAGTFGENYSDSGAGRDFTQVKALAFHKSCIGSVRRQGLTTSRTRKEEILGDLILSYFVEGHGVLRPECAITLTT